VTCAANNSVAWLKCATFAACTISSTSGGIYVDKSYWGVQGWEVSTNSGADAACFQIYPDGGSTIHHIIFANNIANGCMNGGFSAHNNGTSASFDYLVIVGNIAYNAAQTSAVCTSGISLYQPKASDTASGTHMFIAGNFSFGNHNPDPCAGTAPTDGEGVILDTFDFDQGGGTPYTQQAVVENNILVGNYGRGIQVSYNDKGGSAYAPIYLKSNTLWGNALDPNQSTAGFGELSMNAVEGVTATGNLFASSSTTDGAGKPVYGVSLYAGNATDSISGNWITGVSGQNTTVSSSSGFSYGANTLGTSPTFANAAAPGAPSCGGSSSVPACMQSVIAGFTPTAAAAGTFGYQPVSSTNVPDPLFPQWICTANVPSGLVTMGCQ
jgi:hypothetical protein